MPRGLLTLGAGKPVALAAFVSRNSNRSSLQQTIPGNLRRRRLPVVRAINPRIPGPCADRYRDKKPSGANLGYLRPSKPAVSKFNAGRGRASGFSQVFSTKSRTRRATAGVEARNIRALRFKENPKADNKTAAAFSPAGFRTLWFR